MTGRFTHRRVSGFHKAVCEAQNCLHLAWIWIKLFCISWNCLWSPKSSAVTLSPRSLDGLILPWQWHTGLAGVYTVLVQSSSSQHLRPSSLLRVADLLHKFILDPIPDVLCMEFSFYWWSLRISNNIQHKFGWFQLWGTYQHKAEWNQASFGDLKHLMVGLWMPCSTALVMQKQIIFVKPSFFRLYWWRTLRRFWRYYLLTQFSNL